MKKLLAIAGAIGVLLGIAPTALASGPAFTTIDFPGSIFDIAADINDSGQIVGRYIDTEKVSHGFLLSGGTFSSITFPGASFTRALGINRYGDIVGDYFMSGSGSSNSHGYLLRGGVFTSIQVPRADSTAAQGINANGDIVGTYIDSKGTHGFLLRGGTFAAIDFPHADSYTQAWHINDGTEIVGRYEGGDSKYHVFTLTNGLFASVPDVPGAVQTAPGNFSHVGGLNNAGDIVNDYCSSMPCTTDLSAGGNTHGFLVSRGVYTTIDFPGAPLTLAFGVNSSDDIVGVYRDPSGRAHGYVETP